MSTPRSATRRRCSHRPTLRIVTDRPPPLPGGSPGRRAVCTEPSPERREGAIDRAVVERQRQRLEHASGQGALDSQTVEQAMELAGRVPGVIALRDSTYRLLRSLGQWRDR